MSASKRLTIERGTNHFVALYGDESCSPEVHQIMLEIGHDIRSPGRPRRTFASLEAAFPIWITENGPWSRWYIHKSSYADWNAQRPAIEKAAALLQARGYEIEVADPTEES